MASILCQLAVGDFVDRGSWGIETLMLLLVYKWLLPNNVYLVRGNHETSDCTKRYGKPAGCARCVEAFLLASWQSYIGQVYLLVHGAHMGKWLPTPQGWIDQLSACLVFQAMYHLHVT